MVLFSDLEKTEERTFGDSGNEEFSLWHIEFELPVRSKRY